MNLYIGNNYNQTCDSKGPHNKATLTDLPDGTTHVQWLPTARQNTPDYEEKWGGKFSWDNLYCWVSLPWNPPATTNPIKLSLMVDVLVKDMSNVNGFEFQAQVLRQHQLSNMAWQFLPTIASTFDFANGYWVVAFPLKEPAVVAGKWSRFCALYEILPDGPKHDGVQYNDFYTPTSIHRPWVPSTDNRKYLDFAFQFDSLNKGTAIDAVVGTRLVTSY